MFFLKGAEISFHFGEIRRFDELHVNLISCRFDGHSIKVFRIELSATGIEGAKLKLETVNLRKVRRVSQSKAPRDLELNDRMLH